MKNRVFVEKSSTLKHLRTNIDQVMAEARLNMCQKVIENYLKRIEVCKNLQINELIDEVFHM